MVCNALEDTGSAEFTKSDDIILLVELRKVDEMQKINSQAVKNSFI